LPNADRLSKFELSPFLHTPQQRLVVLFKGPDSLVRME